MSNERSRDFGGAQSRGSDRSGAGRESGEEALLELARLIGGQNDPFAPDAPSPAGRPDPRLADVSRAAASPPYDSRGFDDRSGPSRHDPEFADRAPPPAPDDGDYDFADRSRGRGRLDYGAAREEEEEEEYTDDEYAEPDDFDDEEPGRKRRRPSRMITTLLALAVFGGAAAYGYRTMTAAPSSGPPPIIRADNSPTKIKPMSDVKADDARSAPFGEQVVRRDEDPVAVDGAQGSGNAGAADVVPPSPAIPPRGDPKRVHTVPIRADQGTANSPDRPAVRAVAQSAPPPARQVAAALPPQPAPPPPQPAAPPPQAAAPPPQAAAPPPQRQAAVTPPADTPAAAPPESGGYVVQLTAVKSESDAQSEFRRLQAKYASVLNGRQPLIRRKDQGERGVFFVAQVGPFGAKGEADQVCEQLKAAGGTCYVYKN